MNILEAGCGVFVILLISALVIGLIGGLFVTIVYGDDCRALGYRHARWHYGPQVYCEGVAMPLEESVPLREWMDRGQ